MRRTLLGATPAIWLTMAHGLAQQAITTPILSSDANFRGIAGIAVQYGGSGSGSGRADPTANNGVMRTGVFYRSEVLNVSNADLATLSSLRLTRDIDLRTPTEIAQTPDRVPAGAVYINVNILGTPSPPPPGSPPTPQAAATQFAAQYRTLVTNPVERQGFGTVLIDLAHAPGSALYHCSEGKDRTGWTSALLQSIAGVPPSAIMRGYLATDQYEAQQIATRLAAITASHGAAAAAIAEQSMIVQPQYVLAALDQVNASYGSVTAYLMQGLGLSQSDIYVLRARMVDYLTLPGQSGFVGNEAAGAALLNQL